MSNADLIKAKATAFMKQQKMFTSVDIGNAIKREDAMWIGNSEIAKWLRNNFATLNSNYDYQATQIAVNNGRQTANMYHHFTADPDNYTDRDQAAMKPAEFKQIHGFDPFNPPNTASTSTQPVTPPTKKTVTFSSVAPKSNGKRIARGKDRIRIPAAVVKQFGLKPGDSVNPSIFSIKGISKKLRVNADGRIGISRRQLSLGRNNVSMLVRDGILDLQKA